MKVGITNMSKKKQIRKMTKHSEMLMKQMK